MKATHIGDKMRELSPLSKDTKRGMVTYTAHTPSILTAYANEAKDIVYCHDFEILSVDSMKRCSRFEYCSAPKCPLDVLINMRIQVDDDPVCQMNKATRHRYWLSLPNNLKELLPFQGYFEVEYNRRKAGKTAWDSLPEEVKQVRISKLMEAQRGRQRKHGKS